MADENPDAPQPDVEAQPRGFLGGFLGGPKNLIIVAVITLAQAAFWVAVMIIREPGSGSDQAEQNRVFLEDPAILQSRVEIQNFSASVPGPGGALRAMNFNLVLELHYLPEEKRPGATRPTAAQIEVFRTVVVQLESKIRDHLNTFLTGQSYTNLMGDRGPELVKAEIMRFVNNELEKFDFEAQKIPPEISRRRVTNVLLPSWVIAN